MNVLKDDDSEIGQKRREVVQGCTELSPVGYEETVEETLAAATIDVIHDHPLH